MRQERTATSRPYPRTHYSRRERPTNAALFHLRRERSTKTCLLVPRSPRPNRPRNSPFAAEREIDAFAEKPQRRARFIDGGFPLPWEGLDAPPRDPRQRRPRGVRISRGLFTQGRVIPPRINVARPTNRERIARRVCGLLAHSSIAGCQPKHPPSYHLKRRMPLRARFSGTSPPREEPPRIIAAPTTPSTTKRANVLYFLSYVRPVTDHSVHRSISFFSIHRYLLHRAIQRTRLRPNRRLYPPKRVLACAQRGNLVT